MQTGRRTGGGFFWLIMVALFLAGIWFLGRGNSPRYVGAELPEIRSQGTWLNTPAPLTWESLRGDVVWLEFSFLR